jgi:hypothetical protein
MINLNFTLGYNMQELTEHFSCAVCCNASTQFSLTVVKSYYAEIQSLSRVYIEWRFSTTMVQRIKKIVKNYF